ncbi:MAG: LamG-like jellyroll fold domain-containing protein, partial [Nitrososphaerota archaeon]
LGVSWSTRKADGTRAEYSASIYAYRNTWVHVVRMFTSERGLSFWVNGNRVASFTVPSTEKTVLEWNPDDATYPSRFKRFVLGASADFTDHMTVKYGYIRIYNRTLSNQEILNGVINTTGLVVYINASSWNGTHFVDLSGNNNHGIPYGNVQYKVWTQNSYKVTYVGDVSDPAFAQYVYGAYLEYSSGVVNVAPKVTVNATFNWTHPIYGSVGKFTFTGSGTYFHFITINGTPLFTRVIPIQYLTGSYYEVIVERISAPSHYPHIYSVKNCNLTTVEYSSNILKFTVDGPSGTYSTTAVYCPKEPISVERTGMQLYPVNWDRVGTTEGYYYDRIERMLYITVRHSSPVTVTLTWEEASAPFAGQTLPPQPQPQPQPPKLSPIVLPGIETQIPIQYVLVTVLSLAMVLLFTRIKKGRRK